ncbi:hypothetical protein BDW22DRAFT_852925 [Trametopsis cervina]|nr:hypothetical protein BDW22DRAFT_852925 [Trametopsis cervina]
MLMELTTRTTMQNTRRGSRRSIRRTLLSRMSSSRNSCESIPTLIIHSLRISHTFDSEGAAIPSAPDTPLPTSAVGGDDQGNTPQPSTSAAYDENLQADTNYPPHIDSHGPLTQNGTSNEVLRTVSGMTMSLTTNNATSGLVPDVTAAGSNNPLRHLGSHIHALHALSTAAQRLAEALLAELPAEHTDPSDNEPAAPVGIEESTICAGTTVPGEDVTGTRQVEAARGNTSNRDEQLSEERPVQAPDVTTRDSPSSPAGVVTQGSSSQDISSGDDEGGTHPVTFPGTSIAVHGAVNHQLEADMKNASTGLYSAPAVTLSSSSYAHPSHPDRPPETSHRESEGSSARRSSGGKDGKESTHDTGPPGSDGIEPTDT